MCVAVDGDVIELSWQWLRDHAGDAGSFHPVTRQRLVTAATVAAVGPGDIAVEGATMTVTWPDGPAASYDVGDLRSLGPAASVVGGPEAVAWSGGELGDRLTTLTAEEIADDAGHARALAGLERDGVLLIHDVPTEASATRGVLERFGYVRSSIFGDVWEFGSDGALDDTASTRLEITPHTDGTYSNDAPGLLALHCLVYAAAGGANVFVDGHELAARLAAEAPEFVDVLRTIDIPGRYIGDGVHLVAARPVLRHVGGSLVQVSYNHHDRAPFLLPEPTMSELYAALHRFDALANAADLQFEVDLRPGDMVIVDNWRVLHGRRAFTGERHLAGGYVNREDVDSTMRTTRARHR